jgi:hypothetical protein
MKAGAAPGARKETKTDADAWYPVSAEDAECARHFLPGRTAIPGRESQRMGPAAGLPCATPASALARIFGIGTGLVRELNLGLRDSVWDGRPSSGRLRAAAEDRWPSACVAARRVATA